LIVIGVVLSAIRTERNPFPPGCRTRHLRCI
jgi:hypothetical protein